MPKVLIVDQEESICLLYKEVLQENSIDSVYVRDVKQVLYLLSIEQFDLIIIDPTQYGTKDRFYKTSVVKEIRRKYRKIPIIINSIFSIFGSIDHLKSMGVRQDNYVVKSADPTKLLLRVFALLHIKKDLRESPNKEVKIFISYARKDFAKAHLIYSRLRQEEFSPWIDKEDILPGQDWELEIEKAIKECNFFLACLSGYSISKEGYVQKELKKGLEMWERQPEGRVYLIPIRLDKCKVPRRFENIEYCNLFAPDGIKQLLTSIRVGCQERGIDLDLNEEG